MIKIPYIEPKEREKFQKPLREINFNKLSAGELNYLFTSILHDQIIKWHGLNYSNLSSFIGTLECCKLELYRMIAAPYEDKKRLADGGVSELDAKTFEDVR